MEDRITKAVSNYETKLRLGAAGRQSESEIQRQVANFEAGFAQLDQAVQQGKEVLCTAGIATIWFPYYHAFTRELYKLTRQELSEGALSSAYARAVEKWRLRGLDVTVLGTIGVEVFGLAWPDLTGERPR